MRENIMRIAGLGLQLTFSDSYKFQQMGYNWGASMTFTTSEGSAIAAQCDFSWTISHSVRQKQ